MLKNAPVTERGRYRNTKYVIDTSHPHFEKAYQLDVMGVTAKVREGRNVLWQHPKQSTATSKELIDFARCSYLGLDNHPKIVNGAIDMVQQNQALHWSCARTRLNFEHLRVLEGALSSLFSARVVAFSSVWLANLGVMPLLASGHLTNGVKPVIVFDRSCHVSLAYHKPVVADETEVMTIPHNDMNALEDICRNHECVAYVADGVYSMGGSAPVADIQKLQEKYGLFAYIDDAHGISIHGENGEGYVRSQYPTELGDRTIIAASMGKGFGASGGILMLGTPQQEEIFRRYAPPYAFSAAPNLAAVGGALGSVDIHNSPELAQRQKLLRDSIAVFDEVIETPQTGEPFPIRVVAVGSEQTTIESARFLMEQGFYASAVFFPTVGRGLSGLRICPTAAHEHEDIRRLGSLIDDLKKGWATKKAS
ncbi:aminotransferase class I/II-fold pyridoxal phosphate-dependent enzyme [Amylibacter sp. SFDW26]|uniref:8-amino-7-oxononanoate synthase family protein n=1 Tax=Amylibacter sp. SFDW26 TaxID=2652722 RepID=UPI0012627A93|nr:aminotransferase class I/II-fold pyridoxal phosphate-dependent enzyme [Amylibacter sp. SFDW26]KAB7613379.1 aminotransferase class I/II-fold pyridoxal phosphate-dependent enzyme [Amylibacter sp. SFDW26]